MLAALASKLVPTLVDKLGITPVSIIADALAGALGSALNKTLSAAKVCITELVAVLNAELDIELDRKLVDKLIVPLLSVGTLVKILLVALDTKLVLKIADTLADTLAEKFAVSVAEVVDRLLDFELPIDKNPVEAEATKKAEDETGRSSVEVKVAIPEAAASDGGAKDTDRKDEISVSEVDTMNGAFEEIVCFDVCAPDLINCVVRMTEKEDFVDGVDA